MKNQDFLGATDGYVQITAYNGAGEKVDDGKTKTIANNLNPNWNQHFCFKGAQIKKLHFDIRDKDWLSGDDPVGTADLSPVISGSHSLDIEHNNVHGDKLNIKVELPVVVEDKSQEALVDDLS